MEPTKKSHRIIFTIIVILLTAGVSGGGMWYALNQEIEKQNEKLEESQEGIEKNTEAKVEKKEEEKKVEEKKTEVSTGVNYTNSQYGFTLKLPEGWKDYATTEEAIEGSVKVIYFGLPLKKEIKEQDGFNRYYFSPFAVAVQTKKQWADAQNVEGPKDTKLGEDDTYVFSYSTGNGTAETKYDFMKAFGDIKEIVKTFKITK